MNSSYLIPSIFAAPADYDCMIDLPVGGIARRLAGHRGNVVWRVRMYHGGQVLDDVEHELRFEDGNLVSPDPGPYVWKGTALALGGDTGFIENGFTAADDTTSFITKTPVGLYALYSAPGRKSFRVDGDYKYGSPPVIGQIAEYGVVADGYPVVRLDRERDYGESLSLINPYNKAILVNLVSYDGRSFPRIKVPPLSGRTVSLQPLMRPDETRWTGRIQLTANNRVLSYHIRHSMADPRHITDHEHLDPYRSDPTHLPGFQMIRQAFGSFLAKRFGIRWRRL